MNAFCTDQIQMLLLRLKKCGDLTSLKYRGPAHYLASLVFIEFYIIYISYII